MFRRRTIEARTKDLIDPINFKDLFPICFFIFPFFNGFFGKAVLTQTNHGKITGAAYGASTFDTDGFCRMSSTDVAFSFWFFIL